MINGIGATGELFEPFVDAMEILSTREIITFDAPGVGFSSTPLYPPTIRQLALLVANLIDHLEHREVDVLGLSWGGALAQELAYRHPEKVGRLVLTATMHGWTSIPGRPAAMSILLSPTRYYSPQYLYQVAPTLYGGAIRNNRQLIREHAQIRASRPPSTLGYAWQLMALRRWTSWPWLRDLTQPTLLMAGDDDPIIPASNAEAMAREIPHSELDIVDGGHLFLYTQPTEIARRIDRFLADGDKTPRGRAKGRIRGRFITER